jgi:DNA-binding beta-propeller fold protein YncE
MKYVPSAGKLYVSDWATNTILVFDSSTLRQLGSISVGDNTTAVGSLEFDESSGLLYASVSGSGPWDSKVDNPWSDRGGLVAIDTKSDKVIRSIGGADGMMHIDKTSDRLIVIDLFYGQGWALHLSTLTLESTLADFSDCGIWSFSGFNPSMHAVYVGYMQCDTLDVLDTTTLKVRQVKAGKIAAAALNTKHNKLYLSPMDYNGFDIINLANDEIKPVNCSTDTYSIAYDPYSDVAITATEINQTAVIINGSTDTCTTVDMGLSMQLFGPVNTRGDIAYSVRATSIPQMVFYNLRKDTAQCLSIPLPDEHQGMLYGRSSAMDPTNNRMFVGFWQNDPTLTNLLALVQGPTE